MQVTCRFAASLDLSASQDDCGWEMFPIQGLGCKPNLGAVREVSARPTL